MFTQKVLNWFDQVNACQISPTTEETLFGITASSHDTTIIRKFNYTALIMRHYISSAKLNSLAISFQDFIRKLLINLIILKICLSYMFYWEALLPPQSHYTV